MRIRVHRGVAEYVGLCAKKKIQIRLCGCCYDVERGLERIKVENGTVKIGRRSQRHRDPNDCRPKNEHHPEFDLFDVNSFASSGTISSIGLFTVIVTAM